MKGGIRVAVWLAKEPHSIDAGYLARIKNSTSRLQFHVLLTHHIHLHTKKPLYVHLRATYYITVQQGASRQSRINSCQFAIASTHHSIVRTCKSYRKKCLIGGKGTLSIPETRTAPSVDTFKRFLCPCAGCDHRMRLAPMRNKRR